MSLPLPLTCTKKQNMSTMSASRGAGTWRVPSVLIALSRTMTCSSLLTYLGGGHGMWWFVTSRQVVVWCLLQSSERCGGALDLWFGLHPNAARIRCLQANNAGVYVQGSCIPAETILRTPVVCCRLQMDYGRLLTAQA